MPTRIASWDHDDTGVGSGAVSPATVILTSTIFAFLALSLVFAFWTFWPPATEGPATVGIVPTSPGYNFTLLWRTFRLTRDQNLLVIVAIAGALGAMVHVIYSLSKFVGERNLQNSWLLFYFLYPINGVILATTSYMGLRAGLISINTADQSSVFAFTTVGMLSGLFSPAIIAKLRAVVETRLSTYKPEFDKLPLELSPPPMPPPSSVPDTQPSPTPSPPTDPDTQSSAGGDQ
jgi:hypothetical protein